MDLCPIDPVLYNQNCRFQHTGTVDFLLRCSSLADWGEMREQQVVDVGCGPGTSSTWIMEVFPHLGGVVALDAHQEVVDLANVLHPHHKIDYVVADISKRASLECWERAMPKVISTWCLQYLRDQRQAFANIHHILKHHGEAALLFLLQSTYYDALQDAVECPKWKHKFKEVPENYIPESHVKKLDANYYRDILEEVGFLTVLCESERNVHSFNSDDECKGFLASHCTLVKKLPSEMKDDFMKDLFLYFLKRNGRSTKGRILYHYTSLNVLARESFVPLNAT